MSNNGKGFGALQNLIKHAKPMYSDGFHDILFPIIIMFLYEFFCMTIIYNLLYIIEEEIT